MQHQKFVTVLCVVLLAVGCLHGTATQAGPMMMSVVPISDSLAASSHWMVVEDLDSVQFAQEFGVGQMGFSADDAWSSERRVTVWVKVTVDNHFRVVKAQFDHANPPHPMPSEIELALAAAMDELHVRPLRGKNTAVVPIRITVEIAPPVME